jgi:hypothetical protein
MPRLLIFAPCEMVIIAQDQALSLIRVLSDITLATPESVPDNAALPFRWFIAAEWEVSPEERNRQWEQRITLQNERGETRLENNAEFVVADNITRHRMIATLGFMPVLPAGNYRLHISYRESGNPQWIPAQSYPILITRQPALNLA